MTTQELLPRGHIAFTAAIAVAGSPLHEPGASFPHAPLAVPTFANLMPEIACPAGQVSVAVSVIMRESFTALPHQQTVVPTVAALALSLHVQGSYILMPLMSLISLMS